MNNWDKRPELHVVHGEDIPYQYLVDTGNHLAKELDNATRFYPAQSTVMEDYIVRMVTGMNVPHVNMALEGLADHIDNTKREDWMVHHGTVELEEDKLFMEVYVGTYYGQNCKIKVYEVTIG